MFDGLSISWFISASEFAGFDLEETDSSAKNRRRRFLYGGAWVRDTVSGMKARLPRQPAIHAKFESDPFVFQTLDDEFSGFHGGISFTRISRARQGMAFPHRGPPPTADRP